MQLPFLKCVGCKTTYDLFSGYPIYRCNYYGKGDTNNTLEKILPDNLNIPNIKVFIERKKQTQNPYLIFKEFFSSYYLASYYDVNYEELVLAIDNGLKQMGGPGFVETPLLDFPGNLIKNVTTYVKNETLNVAGSHKARHLMGNILYLEVLRKAGIIKGKPNLAIYSCGNAALGAAAVAKAAGYNLDVFIPPNVDAKITALLKNYDAKIIECPRQKGEIGDPCYNRFKEALKRDSVPFSCSGPDNWSNIEGGETLCFELVSQIIAKGRTFDSIVIQVGGGALASSAIKALEEMHKFGLISQIPAIQTVQTEGGFPLVRAYCLIIKEISEAFGLKCSLDFSKEKDPKLALEQNQKIKKYLNNNYDEIWEIAQFVKHNYTSEKIQNVLKFASKNMNSFMWAWETEPHSVAHGILDDITYDWFKIVQGMLLSGGTPIIVSEQELLEANKIATDLTKIKVDCTGTAGFAGAIKLPEGKHKFDNIVTLFTGLDR